MALKYFFEYTVKTVKPDNTIEEVLNRCEIYNDDFVGTATQIKGNVTLTKVSDDDVLKATRGGGLKIQLEANKDLTFEDFQTTNERAFLVKYYRNGILHSNYWLSPEGLFEDYISNEWVISLDCTDGIGFLNNLEYVNNATKEQFTGKQSMLEVVTNCLKRTDMDMNIFISVGVRYVGLTPPNLFARTYVNSDRFIKDDNNTIMNCQEVLTSILELFGAVITQYQGNWYIYKPNELALSPELTFLGFDSDGNDLTPLSYDIDFSQSLGSQINGYYPHHVNKNQQFSRVSPIGAYRVNYKYGIVKSFFENIPLINDSGSVDEWTINDTANLTFPASNEGFYLATIESTSIPTLLATSTSFTLSTGNLLHFNASIVNKFSAPINREITSAKFKVKLDNAGTLYYMAVDGSWSTTDTIISLRAWNTTSNYTVKSQSLPADGSVYIEVFRPQRNQLASSPDILLYNCNFSPVTEELEDVQGEIFTFQNTVNKSTKIAENKTVYNGDSPTDVYVGTLYQEDETTPTEEWFRTYQSDMVSRPLLQIMGEEKMRIESQFNRVYKGDVFGYIDFLSVVTINNFNNVFIPIEYSYDTSANITKLKLREIFNADVSDLETTSVFDYGETTKPTIKG